MDLTVQDNPERQRFEAWQGGELVGFATYQMRDGVVAFTHTEVDPDRRHLGIGGRLIGAALNQVRADGHRALPLCSFVVDYVDRNPEYADLVSR
jgi:uncharacterized protein